VSTDFDIKQMTRCLTVKGFFPGTWNPLSSVIVASELPRKLNGVELTREAKRRGKRAEANLMIAVFLSLWS